MTEYVFKLTDEELANLKLRRGYPGRLRVAYHESWDKEALSPHANFNYELASFYKAGQYVGLRGDLMVALNASLPKRVVKHDSE
jgi:hypothetical protein